MKTWLMVVGGLVLVGAVKGGGESGGPPTAATEIPTQGGHGGLVALLVVVGLVALAAKAGGGGRHGVAMSGSRPIVHSHGNHSRRAVVAHEKAHVRALRRAGAGGGTYRVRRERDGSWSGVTTGRSEAKWAALPAWKKIAVYAAGRHGGPGTGHRDDDAGIQQTLAGVPARHRGRELRKGEAAARRWAR